MFSSIVPICRNSLGLTQRFLKLFLEVIIPLLYLRWRIIFRKFLSFICFLILLLCILTMLFILIIGTAWLFFIVINFMFNLLATFFRGEVISWICFAFTELVNFCWRRIFLIVIYSINFRSLRSFLWRKRIDLGLFTLSHWKIIGGIATRSLF